MKIRILILLFISSFLLESCASAFASVKSNQQGNKMKGFVGNIEKITLANQDFRKVLYTATHSQLVVMSIAPNEEIGEEVHQLDQFIRCEAGKGKAILNGVEHIISNGFAIVIPAGAKHNLINVSNVPLKLYTVYSPPNHRDGTVHKTKADAMADEEEFDGHTSERD